LASGIADVAAAEAAVAAGVAVRPLSVHQLGARPAQGLLLGYAGVPEREIDRGVERLAIALARVGDRRQARRLGAGRGRDPPPPPRAADRNRTSATSCASPTRVPPRDASLRPSRGRSTRCPPGARSRRRSDPVRPRAPSAPFRGPENRSSGSCAPPVAGGEHGSCQARRGACGEGNRADRARGRRPAQCRPCGRTA
jgi:hypothetical protein